MSTRYYRIAGLNLAIDFGKVTFPSFLDQSFEPFNIESASPDVPLLSITLSDIPPRDLSSLVPFSIYSEEIPPVHTQFGRIDKKDFEEKTSDCFGRVEAGRYGQMGVERLRSAETECFEKVEAGHYYYSSREIGGGARVIAFLNLIEGKAKITLWGKEAEAGVRCQLLRMALWATFATWSVKYKRLFLHSSVIVAHPRAILFLGESGTGKSTQSRLWQECFPESWLLNDDCPMISVESDTDVKIDTNTHVDRSNDEHSAFVAGGGLKVDSQIIGNANHYSDKEILVYGTPWSGKTPCYRPVSVPVAAIVRLSQGTSNIVTSLNVVRAFAALQPSAPPMLNADEELSDSVYGILSTLISRTDSYHLSCTPDFEAVACLHQTLFPHE